MAAEWAVRAFLEEEPPKAAVGLRLVAAAGIL